MKTAAQLKALNGKCRGCGCRIRTYFLQDGKCGACRGLTVVTEQLPA